MIRMTKEENASCIVSYLSDGKWRKKDEIVNATGINERTIRHIANETGDIISNSQQGYKLASMATDEEKQHQINDLYSRIRSMATRAELFRKKHMMNHPQLELNLEEVENG